MATISARVFRVAHVGVEDDDFRDIYLTDTSSGDRLWQLHLDKTQGAWGCAKERWDESQQRYVTQDAPLPGPFLHALLAAAIRDGLVPTTRQF